MTPTARGPGSPRPTNPHELLAPLRARVSRSEDPVGVGRLTTEIGAVSTRHGQVLGAEGLRAAADSVREHTQGLGPLQGLVDDLRVTDILVNGGGRIWLDRGHGLVDAGFTLDGEHQVRALAVRLASLAGRRLDEGLPWVDARLPGGSGCTPSCPRSLPRAPTSACAPCVGSGRPRGPGGRRQWRPPGTRCWRR
ncbi:MAG: hypothetical protein U0Q19_05115 [Kineosporiaceae bacterium]